MTNTKAAGGWQTPKWEYRGLFQTTSNPPMDKINELGMEGWEMFFHESSAQWYAYWFKRPLPPEPPQ